ncbi:MAG: hypothetical protein GXY86_14075 [Firmicutes bacterium]|nr:hypothetical protein [Bacillota bacterium]
MYRLRRRRLNHRRIGRGGDTTLAIIGRLEMILETKAQIYLLAIGINDVRCNDKRGATNWAEFSQNMTTICNALKESGAEVFVISIWPVFSNDYTLSR